MEIISSLNKICQKINYIPTTGFGFQVSMIGATQPQLDKE